MNIAFEAGEEWRKKSERGPLFLLVLIGTGICRRALATSCALSALRKEKFRRRIAKETE